MLWTIIQLILRVLTSLPSFELELGAGAGEEKRERVLAAVLPDFEAELTRAQVAGCSGEQLATHIGNVIDGAVGLLNCFGVLPPNTLDAGEASSTGAK